MTTLTLSGVPERFIKLGSKTVWPAVEVLDLNVDETITIDGDDPSILDLAVLARAFPNVRRLHIYDCRTYPRLFMPPEAPCWPTLDFVNVNGPVPLGRPIRHLRFHPPVCDTHKLVQATQNFLHQSSPVIFSCAADLTVLHCVAAVAPSVRFLQVFCEHGFVSRSAVRSGADIEQRNYLSVSVTM